VVMSLLVIFNQLAPEVFVSAGNRDEAVIWAFEKDALITFSIDIWAGDANPTRLPTAGRRIRSCTSLNPRAPAPFDLHPYSFAVLRQTFVRIKQSRLAFSFIFGQSSAILITKQFCRKADYVCLHNP